jgi:hypothetical protein
MLTHIYDEDEKPTLVVFRCFYCPAMVHWPQPVELKL